MQKRLYSSLLLLVDIYCVIRPPFAPRAVGTRIIMDRPVSPPVVNETCIITSRDASSLFTNDLFLKGLLIFFKRIFCVRCRKPRAGPFKRRCAGSLVSMTSMATATLPKPKWRACKHSSPLFFPISSIRRLLMSVGIGQFWLIVQSSFPIKGGGNLRHVGQTRSSGRRWSNGV